MSAALPSPTQALWLNVLSAESAMQESLRAFLVAASGDRVALLRRAFASPGRERAAAVRVLPYLSENERLELFPDLVGAASTANSMVQAARDAICSLSRDWVLERIEATAEPLLAAATAEYQYEEYRRCLELYQQLGDEPLIRRLAERALRHEDEDVREAGQDALARLSRS